MEDIIINRKDSDNLLKMLRSDDQDNNYIALKIIEQSNIKESIGFILILFKFGEVSNEDWEEHCPNCWIEFIKIGLVDPAEMHLSTSKVLKILIFQAATIEQVTLFIELHTDLLLDTLDSWGYPIGNLDINVTLKKDVKQGRITS
jgi:RNA-binding protein YhbY